MAAQQRRSDRIRSIGALSWRIHEWALLTPDDAELLDVAVFQTRLRDAAALFATLASVAPAECRPLARSLLSDVASDRLLPPPLQQQQSPLPPTPATEPTPRPLPYEGEYPPPVFVEPVLARSEPLVLQPPAPKKTRRTTAGGVCSIAAIVNNDDDDEESGTAATSF